MRNEPAPFTVNQRAFFDRARRSWLNVAEGGKRGGKNVLTTLAFCAMLEEHPNKVHLIAGVSIATAKLNIVDCDGYGLLNYFAGRCREGEYKNRDCLYVRTRTGTKIVLISGGAKDGDEKLIKGNTYGMAYITEANECHKKFIQEVFDRTLSSKDRKIFHDLNPKAPTHWYYTEVLDFHQKAQDNDPEYGYNYGHFTIADNMSISDGQLRAVLRTYDKNSVWYKRDILGERRAAEGLIYDTFNSNRKDPRCNIVPTEPRPYTHYYLSVDYGTTNPMSMGLWGQYGGRWYRVKEYYFSSRREGYQKTDEEYYADMVQFLQEDDGRGGRKAIVPTDVIIDPSAASFIMCVKRRGGYSVKQANNAVKPGIELTRSLFRQGVLLINDCCRDILAELEGYAWDEKSPEDKPVKVNDHAVDDMRYFAYSILRRDYDSLFYGSK